ncbi:MAG TPA: penicillin-binding transpeptidase domain-containing protein [Thermoleophilaceae bacterium]|nr:penicillin-binding transpeptidase domain-containing protein [Thermoleophilaceae bacterium]
MNQLTTERRRRLTYRALPVLGGLAALALLAGVMVGSGIDSGAERTARAFGRAWQQGDYRRMHELLTAEARGRWDERRLKRAYAVAAATATAGSVDVGDPQGERRSAVRLPVEVRTRVFGTVRGEVSVPIEGRAVAWAPHLVFPGLEPGDALRRRTRQPARGRILSRNGKTLARGPARSRSSPLGPLAASIAGQVGKADGAAAREVLYARGFPRGWPVGKTGLERAFERQLAGRPGGELLAGSRVLARSRPVRGRTVRSTIDTRLQGAAVRALGGRFGGIAALDAGTGEIRALAGVAFSALQPPGSTFKIVTTTAALEARKVKLGDRFPVQTRALIDGVALENANGESCGGTFEASFAHSCNSVFAPLGVKVGAKRLVSTAERYGFNTAPSVPGERPSTLPPARDIRTPLEVGSTAIGQGKVLATPLELASIAQTVSAGGVRSIPTLRVGRRGSPPVRVTTPRVARTLERLMVDVVAFGTGTSAALPGVKVAGKTGTAELGDTRGPNADTHERGNTDAWFAAYAPVGRPRIAVGVMLVRAGAGGQTAAPAARVVLDAAL